MPAEISQWQPLNGKYARHLAKASKTPGGRAYRTLFQPVNVFPLVLKLKPKILPILGKYGTTKLHTAIIDVCLLVCF